MNASYYAALEQSIIDQENLIAAQDEEISKLGSELIKCRTTIAERNSLIRQLIREVEQAVLVYLARPNRELIIRAREAIGES